MNRAELLQKIVMPAQNAAGYLSNAVDGIYDDFTDEELFHLESALEHLEMAVECARLAIGKTRA